VVAIWTTRIIPLLALAALLAACAAQRPPDTTEDGLVRVDVKGIDHAYMRPGANLAPYRRLLIDPVEVAFSKDWDPERTASHIKLSADEREKIRSDLANLFMKTFKVELEKGGYAVVEAAAPDVLRVTPKLEDVYINAPDVMAPGRTRTYVMNAGRMSLLAELRDSETGAIIARVSDQSEARDEPYFELATSVSNSVEARRMIADWARILRARLDTVRMRSEADKPLSP
jgi:hypothetical protein